MSTPSGSSGQDRAKVVTSIVIPIVAAVLAAFAATLSAYLSYQVGTLTAKIAQLKNQFDEANALAQSSHSAIPNLIGKNKLAALEISNLYFLAGDDTVAKRQVIKLVAFAQDPVLNESLSRILDAEGRRIANEPDIRALFGAGKPSKAKSGSGSDVAPDQGTQTTLLQAATAAATSGWSYLGRGSGEPGRSTLPNALNKDSTVRGNAVPAIGSFIEFKRTIYLRAESPKDANHFAPASGVIAAGATAVVKDMVSVRYRADQQAVWAHIELVAHGHGETDVPVPIGSEHVKFYIERDKHSTSIHVRNIGTQAIHVALVPKCADLRSCRPIENTSVPPVEGEHDAGNDFIYTMETLDPGLAFDWKVWL